VIVNDGWIMDVFRHGWGWIGMWWLAPCNIMVWSFCVYAFLAAQTLLGNIVYGLYKYLLHIPLFIEFKGLLLHFYV
jgi:hypothetical protein